LGFLNNYLQYRSVKGADLKLINKMKNLLSIIVACMLLVNTGYAQQKPFEGTIRIAFSMNFDNFIRSINTMKEEKALPFANELMAGYNADYEIIAKVKGNKFVNFNTQNGTSSLFDCDKGGVYVTYPYAKVVIKYTAAEWQQAMAASTFKYDVLKDSVQKFGGYASTKTISTTTFNGVQNSSSEMWVANDIIFPQCYIDLSHAPPGGCIMLAKMKIISNNASSDVYCIVTEIDTSEVSDEAFEIPKNYKIFTPKDFRKAAKVLISAAKNKKTYAVGSKIPETFWDF